jgi:hypothetical protein
MRSHSTAGRPSAREVVSETRPLSSLGLASVDNETVDIERFFLNRVQLEQLAIALDDFVCAFSRIDDIRQRLTSFAGAAVAQETK